MSYHMSAFVFGLPAVGVEGDFKPNRMPVLFETSRGTLHGNIPCKPHVSPNTCPCPFNKREDRFGFCFVFQKQLWPCSSGYDTYTHGKDIIFPSGRRLMKEGGSPPFPDGLDASREGWVNGMEGGISPPQRSRGSSLLVHQAGFIPLFHTFLCFKVLSLEWMMSEKICTS